MNLKTTNAILRAEKDGIITKEQANLMMNCEREESYKRELEDALVFTGFKKTEYFLFLKSRYGETVANQKMQEFWEAHTKWLSL